MLSHVWTKVSRKLLYKDLQIKVDFRHDWLTFLRVIAFCSKNRFADFSLLCFHISEWKVRLAYLWRTLLLQSSGSVPFGTCICCNVETFHSLTCRVHGPFEFRTYLGILILLCSTLSCEVQNKLDFRHGWPTFHEFLPFFQNSISGLFLAIFSNI